MLLNVIASTVILQQSWLNWNREFPCIIQNWYWALRFVYMTPNKRAVKRRCNGLAGKKYLKEKQAKRMQEVHLKLGKGKCCRIPLLAGGLRIQKKRWLWWGKKICGTVTSEFVQNQLLYTDKSLIQWLKLHTWVDKKNEEQDWTSYMVENCIYGFSIRRNVPITMPEHLHQTLLICCQWVATMGWHKWVQHPADNFTSETL